MHELSVATGIVDRALAVADEHGTATVDRLTLEVGAATHVNPEQLRFCLDLATRDTAADGAAIEIETVTPFARCGCGWEGEPGALDDAFAYAPDVRCPDCHDRVELVRGRECRLSKVAFPAADTGAAETEREDHRHPPHD